MVPLPELADIRKLIIKLKKYFFIIVILFRISEILVMLFFSGRFIKDIYCNINYGFS